MKTKLLFTTIALICIYGCSGQENGKLYSELLDFENNPFNFERNKWEIDLDSIGRVKTVLSKFDSTENGLVKTVLVEFKYRKEKISVYMESIPDSDQVAFVELDRDIEFYTWDNEHPEDLAFLGKLSKLLNK